MSSSNSEDEVSVENDINEEVEEIDKHTSQVEELDSTKDNSNSDDESIEPNKPQQITETNSQQTQTIKEDNTPNADSKQACNDQTNQPNTQQTPSANLSIAEPAPDQPHSNEVKSIAVVTSTSSVASKSTVNSPSKPSESKKATNTKPMEDLIEETLKLKEYQSRAELLNDKDPKALLYWAKTISNHCHKLQKQNKPNYATDLHIAFHRSAADKFQQCASIDPTKSFAVRSTGSAPTDGQMSLNLESVKQEESEYPRLELAFEWAMAAYRFGKALDKRSQNTRKKSDPQNTACFQYHLSLSLCASIIEHEPPPRTYTLRV